MNFKTHNDKDINSNGTCLQGNVTTKYSRLIELFGPPTNGDEYKTDAEWNIEFNSGEVATVYNWKDGKNYLGEEGLDVENITDWHIGGKKQIVVNKIKNLILEGN